MYIIIVSNYVAINKYSTCNSQLHRLYVMSNYVLLHNTLPKVRCTLSSLIKHGMLQSITTMLVITSTQKVQ